MQALLLSTRKRLPCIPKSFDNYGNGDNSEDNDSSKVVKSVTANLSKVTTGSTVENSHTHPCMPCYKNQYASLRI